MKKRKHIYYLTILLLLPFHILLAQEKDKKLVDSIPVKQAADTIPVKKKKEFDPHQATFRSAVIPGWGQIYNKSYWKLPLVYGALGTTAVIFFYNVKTYKELRQTFIYMQNGDTALINPIYKGFSPATIQTYRNSVRQDVDYSVLFFLIFWGLNVVDATVDAHLKMFDVNENLSLELKPGHSSMANTTGVSLVLNIGKRNYSR